MINKAFSAAEKMAGVVVFVIVLQLLLCFIPVVDNVSIFDTAKQAVYMITEEEESVFTCILGLVVVLGGISASLMALLMGEKDEDGKRVLPIMSGPVLSLVGIFHRMVFKTVWDLSSRYSPEMNIFGFLQILLPVVYFIIIWLLADEAKASGTPTSPTTTIKTVTTPGKGMIICKGCGREVSEKENWCPHCSSYLKK